MSAFVKLILVLQIFFEVLRTRPNDLVTVLNLTPYSREEFQRCFGEVDPNHIDPGLERARRLFVTSWQSIGGLTEDMQNSWRCVNGISKSHKAPCEYWTFDHLLEIAERYQNIEIDNRDALEIIRKMNSPEVLIYADPPYLKETRVRPEKTYKFEPDPEDDESWHQELLKLLINHHGPAYLSGDFSELYDSNLVNWQRVETQVKTNSNSSRIATECLWIDESAQFAIEHEKLATGHQLSLELV